jgi:ribosomal protein S18 acetylase RimI-like enzyme
LRLSIGWTPLGRVYQTALKRSVFYICAFEGENLIGFLDVVGNGVTDAYIQNLLVAADWQGRGIGKAMMELSVKLLTEMGVRTVWLIFDPELEPFYRQFGFAPLSGGRLRLGP